ncbi:MAG: hypothetical protein ACR2OD_03175, partial [Gaiellaceae bacterium]
FTPLEAGVRLLPQIGLAALIAPFAARMMSRHGVAPMLVIAFAAEAGGLVGLSRIDESTTYAFLVPFQVLIAIAVAIVPTASLTIVVSSASRERSGLLSGVQAAFLNFGNVFSIAILGAVAASTVAGRFTAELLERGITTVVEADASDLAQGLVPSVEGFDVETQEAVDTAALAAFTSSMGTALLIGVAAAAGGVVLALLYGRHVRSGQQSD